MEKKFNIGGNYYRGVRSGGIISAYSQELTNDDTLTIGSGMDITHCKIGDFSGAYEILKQKIKDYESLTIQDIAKIVCDTVWEYFGEVDNINERLSYFPDLDYEEELGIGKISDLKGKSAAMCVERASLAHNLLKSLNVNSTLKFSEIKIDGKYDLHAFNLIENDNMCYVFDTSLVRRDKTKIEPILVEIPPDYYSQLTRPMSSDASLIKYSLGVTFDGVNNTREVIYSPDKENMLTVDLSLKNLKK